MPIPIVLDTNFLLLPFQAKVDFEREVERLIEEPHFFVVLQQVVDELREMASKQRKFSPAARAALVLIEKRGFTVDREFKGKPDAAMVAYCTAKNAVLATLDAGLRRKAKAVGARVIFLRDKGHLALA